MQQRYLVRRRTQEVWIWTEALAAAFPDLEDVYAETAEEAKVKKAMPDQRNVSLEQLEEMKKADLMLFAKVRLGVNLDANLSKPEMLDTIKETIFLRSADETTGGMVAGDAGARATIEPPVAKANPVEVEAESDRRIREAHMEADKAEAAALARIAASKQRAEEAEKGAPAAPQPPAPGPDPGPIGKATDAATGDMRAGDNANQPSGA